MCPWIIIRSAVSLLSFMSAYGVFMGPIAGIMCTDYWFVKNRKYDVPELYNPRGIYRYQSGINWRSFIATFAVMAPVLPGVAYAVSPNNVFISTGLKHLYSINWLYSFFTSSVLYYLLNLLFPNSTTLIERVVPGVRPAVESVDSDAEKYAGSNKTFAEEERKGGGSEVTVA